MTLAQPQYLLLLIPVALLLFRWGLPFGLAGLLRALTALLLVLALAEPSCLRAGSGQDVVVVVDRSRSMPAGTDTLATELIRNLEAKAGSTDRIGVVNIGREARIERAPTAGRSFAGFLHEVDGDGSDLPGALEKAASLMSPDRAGRILLLSDGLPTTARTLTIARQLSERGVPIDYRYLGRTQTGGDVAVRAIHLPSEVAVGAPFQFTAELFASEETSVPYVLRRGALILAKGTASLHPGDNQLAFRDRIEAAGLAEYSLELDAASDAVPENNRGRGILRVTGDARVLVIRPDGKTSALAAALKASSFNVVVTTAAPRSLEALDGVSVVVLENTPASALGDDGLHALASYVRELGGGLLLTGGRGAFGEGGYYLSPLDPLLPVSMELREEQHKANIALGISLDRSGSMTAMTPEGKQKIELAAEGAVAALRLLSKGDEAAVWAVDTRAHAIFPLMPVESGLSLDLVASIQSEGGGIFIGAALDAAAEELRTSRRKTRHLILFADAADSEEPGNYQQLLARMQRDATTVSVIGLGKDTDPDANLLRDVAKRGGGRIYFSDRASELPRLFSQETIVSARSAFVDDPTPVVFSPDLSLLGGVDSPEAPRLGGYNLTYLRPRANVALRSADENTAPILAFWQAGLGHTAAFTGEADGEFSGGLRGWGGYRSLFAHVVRHLQADDHAGELLAKVHREGNDLHVTVEVDASLASTTTSGTATLVAGDGAKVVDALPLRWEDAHRLGAHFPLSGNGSFFPLIRLGDRVVRAAPAALPYAAEFEPRPLEEGRTLLRELAALTGGVERLSLNGMFDARTSTVGRRSLATFFVMAALLLLLLEVALRRLVPGGVAIPGLRRLRRAAASPATIPPAPAAVVETKPAPVVSALEKARERAQRRTES